MTDTIQKIHECPWKGVIAITGCAPGLVTNLLAPGGGSATVLESIVPYATKSLEQFINKKPSKEGWKFCSAEVAAEMASAAFSRATELLDDSDDDPVFGLGITATLRKNGPEREGRVHQVFLSFQTANLVYNHHVIFDSSLSRLDEEHMVSQVALGVLSRHLLGIRINYINSSDTRIEEGWLVKESTERQRFSDGLQKLLDGSGQDVVWSFEKDELIPLDRRCGEVVIPGSFNPLHKGHCSMVEAAKKHFETQGLSLKPILELSISNVDKGRLSGHEVLSRGTAFCAYTDCRFSKEFADLYFTDAPDFVAKSFLFPDATFVIGIDTWYRIIDPKYYRHDVGVMNECHAQIKENGGSFLVLGRLFNGSYHTFPSDTKTKGFAVGLSEEEFRVDLSSSQIRSGNGR